MIKVSLIVMIVLTGIIGTILKWREEAQARTQPRPKKRRGLVAGLKHDLNRWVTAAAVAALATIIIVGGLNWLRVWQGS
ncbi:hypothetical protein IAI18_03830 [Acetobacteraceae bacterium H6797]|nr:hypothetical protein [Acetobacteraceae bacterium H6797]